MLKEKNDGFVSGGRYPGSFLGFVLERELRRWPGEPVLPGLAVAPKTEPPRAANARPGRHVPQLSAKSASGSEVQLFSVSPIRLQLPLCSAAALRRFSPVSEVAAGGKFGVVSVSHTLAPHVPPERARPLRGAHESSFPSAFCFALFSAKVEVESTRVQSGCWLDSAGTQEGGSQQAAALRASECQFTWGTEPSDRCRNLHVFFPFS